jgi:hypothetical protein
MQDFAKSMQQVDATIDFKYWTPVGEVWNETKPSSASFADNMSSIIITKSTSMRCLNAGAKEYCAKNLWRLQGLWDDVDAALLIAHRLFSARIGEYKKLLKTLIRVVYETYGMWSIKFKMYFVLSGLIKFSRHFQNDHDQCARFIWWTQCTTAYLNEYLPAQDYINNVSGGRGVRFDKGSNPQSLYGKPIIQMHIVFKDDNM